MNEKKGLHLGPRMSRWHLEDDHGTSEINAEPYGSAVGRRRSINFKVLLVIFKSFYGLAAGYISDPLTYYCSLSHIRGSSVQDLSQQ